MKKSMICIIIIAIVLAGIIAYAIIAQNIKTNKVNENIANTSNENNEEENININTTTTSKQSNEDKNNIAQNEEIEAIQEDNKKEEETDMYSSGKHHATIVVKDYGTIKLELDADVAPITVANFAKLVNEGFYDGLTFHRIMDGFMIQGGDPEGTGFGGSSQTIKGEFKANGVENNISHVRGVISMARATGYNTASSQFFIVHKDSKFLDGAYAGFGKVLEGMDVVDKICEVTPVVDNNGTVQKKNQPIIEKISMDD